MMPVHPWRGGCRSPFHPICTCVHVFITFYFTFSKRENFVTGSDLLQRHASPSWICPGRVSWHGVGEVPCLTVGGWGFWAGTLCTPLRASLHWSSCNARHCAGCHGCHKAAVAKQETRLQVLISIFRGLCKNEHGNTQSGKFATKHQAGRLLCQIFKVSWRKMVWKDYCDTVSWHIPYTMNLYHSVKSYLLDF